MSASIIPVIQPTVNAAMVTSNPAADQPTTSTITFAAQTNASCDCTQLRYAVIALATILGVLVLSLVVFAVLKARRRTRGGVSAGDGDVKELKRDVERRERDGRGKSRGRRAKA